MRRSLALFPFVGALGRGRVGDHAHPKFSPFLSPISFSLSELALEDRSSIFKLFAGAVLIDSRLHCDVH